MRPDTRLLRARGGAAAEPRQQPPVCSCVALGSRITIGVARAATGPRLCGLSIDFSVLCTRNIRETWEDAVVVDSAPDAGS